MNANRLILITLFGSSALLFALGGCDRASKPAASPDEPRPAAAGTVRLSQELQKRLGIVVTRVSRREIQNTLATTGWLEAPPGSEATVKAPLAGFVTEIAGQRLPKLGQFVDKRERLVALQVFLTPQEIAQLVSSKEDVDIAIEQSRVSMKLAQEQLERLASARDAVPGTRIADLKEIYERSKAAYNESRDKLPFLLQEPYDGLALVKPVSLEAPIAGSVLSVHVAPDQFVIQGDPLWTIADWSTLWARVPVFETDLPEVSRGESALLAVPGTLARMPATPVKALSTTRPRSRTVELLYEVRNADLALRSGQAVSIELPLGAAAEQVVVPKSAVLYDAGTAWVYLRAGDEEFRRQRIETGRLLDRAIVVTRGLAGGEEVVSVGAESLYGEEFKVLLPKDDD
jgi:RND family efflux transporter MFP subunit